jgi:SAM-dependent methyltransferase
MTAVIPTPLRRRLRQVPLLRSFRATSLRRGLLRWFTTVPPPGHIDFGDLRRTKPIDRDFGSNRGLPIDRFYIEHFLAQHAPDVRGRVLEIGENTYTRRFGGARVVQSDVLHVTEGNPAATFVADLTNAGHIPSDAFDCVILTQTLQLIYDCRTALGTLHRILKPGGVLLATFPGITQVYSHEWADTWYWSFTKRSAERLFGELFLPQNLAIETHGNVLAAICFLHGIATEELQIEELERRDPCFQVLISVRAVKGGTG